MPLVLIDHDESNLCLSCLYADVAATPDDNLLSASSINATKITCLSKSTFRKNAVSASVKWDFKVKKRR